MTSQNKFVPYVRIVVLNYDGGDVTIQCIRSLLSIDYPTDRYEVVLIDNGSVDGLDWRIPREFPTIKYKFSQTNEGFARGCNLGMVELDNIDAVALVNNDAVVEPTFLRVLTERLFSSPKFAGVSPLMLLDVKAIGLNISPLAGQCLKISGLQHAERIVRFEVDGRWSQTPSGALASKPASVWVSTQTFNNSYPTLIELSSKNRAKVLLSNDESAREIFVSTEPSWYDVSDLMKEVAVVNNAGGIITDQWFGGDRGFKQINVGQFDRECEVLSFCGGAVLLKTEFLKQVGAFDPEYFLYYEDTELSLRGRRQGWEFWFTPRTRVIHRHSYSSVENSAFFNFWVDRNRRLTLIRHAPLRMALKVSFSIFPYYLRKILVALWRYLRYRRRVALKRAMRLVREMLSCLKAFPNAYKLRRHYAKTCSFKIEYDDWLEKSSKACG